MSNKDRSLCAERLRSFIYAGRGIALVLRNEPNARIHLLAAVSVIVMALVVNVSRTDMALLCIAITMVFVAETINTAIERLTDLASPDLHPLAAQAKDIAAGAVLIAAMGAVIVGLIVFVPKVV